MLFDGTPILLVCIYIFAYMSLYIIIDMRVIDANILLPDSRLILVNQTRSKFCMNPNLFAQTKPFAIFMQAGITINHYNAFY